jgi:excisionase family DNA binding protein
MARKQPSISSLPVDHQPRPVENVPGGPKCNRGTSSAAQETSGALVMTVAELARLLRLNRKTVYAAVSHGEIPGARRIGHSFRVSREAVLAWLHHKQQRCKGEEIA